MMQCSYRPTMHAKDRMIERGISRAEAIEAILKGSKKRIGPKIHTILKGIEIVYIQKPCNYHVITMYWR